MQKLPSLIRLEQSVSKLSVLKQLILRLPNSPEKLQLLATIEAVEAQAAELETLPQEFIEFNGYFNGRGWRAHDSMSTDTVKEANRLARQGDIDTAENMLMESYTQRFDFFFIILRGLPNYFEREHIFEKAKERFFNEDYISCVPLILMMIDGISNDVMNKGIFAKDINLDAWDCFSTIGDDIDEFIKLITSSRSVFNHDQISIPYRNGILHGRDVGYDNKLLAIKSWSLLFSTRDILIKKINAQKDMVNFEEEQQRQLDELIKYIEDPQQYDAEATHFTQSLYKWKPTRTESEWEAALSAPSQFQESSPEYAVTAFLASWKEKNYGLMAKAVFRENGKTIGKLAGDIRNRMRDVSLDGFFIESAQEDKGSVAFWVNLHLSRASGKNYTQKGSLLLFSYRGDTIVYDSNPANEWRLSEAVLLTMLNSLLLPD